MESVLSGPKTARKTAAKVSEDVPGTTGDCADDASEPRDSQAIPKKRKFCLDKKDKTTPANESTEKQSGKKAKVQTEPAAKPTPPARITPAEGGDKAKKESKKLMQGSAASFGESADSRVGLQSKLKKKKVKVDKE
ncbi:uncharacterized protein LOC143776673 isoform X2 [Ranitomeya variabilis]|uniref:uncharacterized protein LOC143776673 isoform X2 n=1 Tax=Ranitomeya variabilis TaxID=490064 RepID=UPI004056BA41